MCLMVHVAPAQTAESGPDGMTFAACTGRLSALLEHQWLLSDPGAERTALQRDAMWSLAEAALPPEQGAAALHLRVSAKAAQAGLLLTARFGGNVPAARQSDAWIAACRSLLLG